MRNAGRKTHKISWSERDLLFAARKNSFARERLDGNGAWSGMFRNLFSGLQV
jgi:hypothetical protein